MAHTYVIQSVHQQPGAGDPPVIISGTVDGVSVTAQTWLSVYTANGANAIAAQNFCINQLLAAFNAIQTSTPPNSPPPGTTVIQ